uniref:Uncharacterized protein n=1 Tax=Strongyloides venezuelensis TaxID=75913 RepID=A0A0K0FM68_STRVS
MVDAFKNFCRYELESLVIGEDFTRYLTAFCMKSITFVARYFKEIQFSICKCHPSFTFLKKYFSQMLKEFTTSEFFLLKFDIRFNVPKCDVNV